MNAFIGSMALLAFGLAIGLKWYDTTHEQYFELKKSSIEEGDTLFINS